MSEEQSIIVTVKRNLPPVHTTHGHSKNRKHTRVYSCWHLIKQRCLNPKASGYDNYGGRGIRVCDRWLIFENFLIDMGEPSDTRMQIDRINNDGNYEPGNCRWVTIKQQMSNTTRNVFLSFNGESKTISQWAERLGIKVNTLVYRIKRKWTIERAMTQCVTKRQKRDRKKSKTARRAQASRQVPVVQQVFQFP